MPQSMMVASHRQLDRAFLSLVVKPLLPPCPMISSSGDRVSNHAHAFQAGQTRRARSSRGRCGDPRLSVSKRAANHHARMFWLSRAAPCRSQENPEGQGER